MSASFPVLLDACVLVPAVLRDVLLTAGEVGLYRPLWSAQILDEMQRALVERLDIAPEAAVRVRSEMVAFFPTAASAATKIWSHL